MVYNEDSLGAVISLSQLFEILILNFSMWYEAMVRGVKALAAEAGGLSSNSEHMY